MLTTMTPTAKVGDTPADFSRAEPSTPAPNVGDTPVDHPGAKRSPRYDAPRTMSIVRPKRTVVRDVDETLPIVLAATAIAVALAGLGVALASARRTPQRLPGRSD
jgi:hypothetical protein